MYPILYPVLWEVTIAVLLGFFLGYQYEREGSPSLFNPVFGVVFGAGLMMVLGRNLNEYFHVIIFGGVFVVFFTLGIKYYNKTHQAWAILG